jgi:hypothetical protein
MYISPRLEREFLADGSFIELVVDVIKPDTWRRHGYRYRLAWIQKNQCRVLFDNHHGKTDHVHIDQQDRPYCFNGIDQLIFDFF